MMESMFTIGSDDPMTRGMRKLFQTWSHGRGQKLEVLRRSDNECRTYLFYGRKGQEPRSFELVHHRFELWGRGRRALVNVIGFPSEPPHLAVAHRVTHR